MSQPEAPDSDTRSESRADDSLVELAAVVRSHGLRGELMLKPFNPESELWDDLEEIVLKLPSGELSPRVVTGSREHSGSILLTLEGVGNRDTADLLRGSLICVPRSALPELPEDEYYLSDLRGLEARDVEGKVVGRVLDIIEYPASCCLVVQSEDGIREVPDVDRYVPKVRVREGYLVVDHLADIEPQKVTGLR